ncbi:MULTISPECIES: hypothetical protein [Roseivirga]|nr:MULTISPECIES: hypothetical protein [Roseivirga]MBO6497507.1 hypothetical protein [Roseivirga sp.]MBO6661097.1 hypothetical protein [Roseivirga sp.]MBO6908919.1 hypothetical protein [Roseivirga sp.]WPZ11820.1 hypothetical protein T7867_06830 [Roseivirga spongicola]
MLITSNVSLRFISIVMKTQMKIEERINELKWKSLSPYYRLVLKKEDVLSNKFKSKEKKRELTYYIKTNGFLLFLLSTIILYVLFFAEANTEFLLFLFLAVAIFVAQRIELVQRLSNLNEAKFLKKLLEDFKE